MADAQSLERSPAVSVLVRATEDATFRALDQSAMGWGAQWQRHGTGGRLELPVVAGLRRGQIVGSVSSSCQDGGVRLECAIEHQQYRLQGRELVVLLFGALGGLFIVLAPFLPDLFELIPIAGILLLLAWFLVVARVRHQGLADFFDDVKDEAETNAGQESSTEHSPPRSCSRA